MTWPEGALRAHELIKYRGERFVLSRDELLTLPEFVLLSLFPNGILPESHMNFLETSVHPVDVSKPHKRTEGPAQLARAGR